MHSGTLSLLRDGIRQAEGSIAQLRLMLAQAEDAAIRVHLEANIRDFVEIVEMHVRTEQILARNQQLARELMRKVPPDDHELDRLCDEAMLDDPAARPPAASPA